MAAIIVASSVPGKPPDPEALPLALPDIHPLLQNLFHVPLYGGLFLCWHYQNQVPGRYGTLGDLALDLFGIALFAGLAYGWGRLRRGPSPRAAA
jgi:hypothetical protein